MDQPYWYKLLDCWIHTDGYAGLTVPFLIGVQREYLTDAVSADEPVKALFKEIVNGPAFDYCTTIEYCRTINAYRLGLTERQDLDMPHFCNEHGEVTLAFEPTEFGGHDLPAIIRLMLAEYGDLISAGHYSKGRGAFGEWEPFTAEDRSFIERALK